MAVGRSPLSMQTLMVKKSTHEGIKGFSADPELTGLDNADFFAVSASLLWCVFGL